MIITRTPFRVSFCGGGSDLPVFYEKHGGCVLSTTINKYMYILTHPYFDRTTTIFKYSKTEIVRSPDEVEHRYFKRLMKDFDLRGIEIASIADIPSGTGLGSSSSFIVGVLHNISSYKGHLMSKEQLASSACEFEIEKLGLKIGKQDQYAAAYGGLNFYDFHKDGSVEVSPVILPKRQLQKLENSLMLFYIGGEHSSEKILEEQGKNISNGDREKQQLMMCEIARQLRDELMRGNVDSMGKLLHESWQLKRTLASGISNPVIDQKYEIAMKNGALGGKLLGAGGSGFLLFYVPEELQQQVAHAVALPNIPFEFDRQGSCILYVGEKPKRGHFEF